MHAAAKRRKILHEQKNFLNYSVSNNFLWNQRKKVLQEIEIQVRKGSILPQNTLQSVDIMYQDSNLWLLAGFNI